MTAASKRAATSVPVHDLISARWSPVSFASRPVAAEQLRSLFEAARWAPSSFNEQPWRYILATRDEPAEFERMLSVLVQANREWARHAPVLALSVAKRTFTRNGKPNRHYLHDTGAASALLCLQAAALGLFVHQMAGYDAARARELFAIPEDFEPVAAMAIGYLGDPAGLPESLRARDAAPRERKPLEEMLFSGGWGQASAIVR
jgi:nitroreductase